MEGAVVPEGSGGDKKGTRSKKPRSETTLETLKECQQKLAGAQEKAERSAERLVSAIDGRVTWLGDTALQEVKQGFKHLETQLERLFKFTQDRLMKCYFGNMDDIRRCQQAFVDQCVSIYLTSRSRESLEQPSIGQSADAVLATIVVAGTARKKEATYVPPQAVFRLVYQPALSSTYNNFEHVRIPYTHASRLFPDSARYVMVDEYHAPPMDGVPLTFKDELTIVRAFKPAVATCTLYLTICPEILNGKRPDLADISLGNEFIVLDDYMNFINTCVNNAEHMQHLENPLERSYLFQTFQSFLISRVACVLDNIHRKVQADNVDNFRCNYITPAFLQSVWNTSASPSCVAEAFDVAADHLIGKRRRLPPLRRSAKSRQVFLNDSSSSSSSSSSHSSEQDE